MSSYSLEWLNCRYPYDASARNPDLVARLLTFINSRKKVKILDLGAGNGSNYRFFLNKLSTESQWTCVEQDPVLAEDIKNNFPGVDVVCDSVFNCLPQLLLQSFDVVMGNALLDLFTREQMNAVLMPFLQQGSALYFSINYTNTHFYPADPDDFFIISLYHDHMRRQRDFGNSMGPDASACFAELFVNLPGCVSFFGDSLWEIERGDQKIRTFLLEFIRSALLELKLPAEDRERVALWFEKRDSDGMEGVEKIVVSHKDCFLLPEKRKICTN